MPSATALRSICQVGIAAINETHVLCYRICRLDEEGESVHRVGVIWAVQGGCRVFQRENLEYGGRCGVGDECPSPGNNDVDRGEKEEDNHTSEVEFVVRAAPTEQALDGLEEEHRVDRYASSARGEIRRVVRSLTVY